MQANKTGKFIVIDGTDGSGKGTQTEILVKKLGSLGYDVAMADFPQYGQASAGLVEKYLNGNYGKAEEVGPYRASIFYACDRYDASFKIRKWLEEGKIVISNRYVTANMGHQGGKISSQKRRKKYFDWLYELEYKIFNIPKPDLNIILHVDAAIAQKLVDQKGHRDYVNGAKRDIHEADINHLRQAEQVYLEIAKSFSDFTLIECVKNEIIMTREEISNLILGKVNKLIQHNNPLPFLNNIEHEQSIHQPTLKIEKINPKAKIPKRAYAGDAGLDLYSVDYYSLYPSDNITVKTGIRMAIPTGYAGLIWDKSGVAKSGIHTTAGVIDSNYRGEIMINVINLSQDIYNIAPGQKIAQILIQPTPSLDIKEDKIDDNTSRNANAFGSSGLF